jgi:hypothetical protein
MIRQLSLLCLAIVMALFLAPAAHAQTAPFVRTGATVSISVSSTSAHAALSPTNSPTMWVCNTGSTLANVGFGDSAYAATSSDTPIPAGLCANLSPNGATYMAAITASSTTTVTGTPGTGTVWGAAGSSGGSGSGGNVNITQILGAAPSLTNPLWVFPATGASWAVTGTFWQATQPVSMASGVGVDGWDATQGTKADAPCALPATTTACSMNALAKAIANAVNSPILAQSTNTVTIGQVGGQVNITPTDCSAALSTGGTAQNIIGANTALHGFTIANIDTSAGSGEPVWFSFTTTAAASAIASYPLAAPTATTFANLSSWTSPTGFGTNHAVSVIAATAGHKISCTYW